MQSHFESIHSPLFPATTSQVVASVHDAPKILDVVVHAPYECVNPDVHMHFPVPLESHSPLAESAAQSAFAVQVVPMSALHDPLDNIYPVLHSEQVESAQPEIWTQLVLSAAKQGVVAEHVSPNAADV